jgi:hypothetical protein
MNMIQKWHARKSKLNSMRSFRSIEPFEEMLALKEELVDLTLGLEALKRLANFKPEESISHADMLAKLGIAQSDLDETDIEID